MKLKKWMLLLLTLMLCLALAACGAAEEETPAEEPAAEDAEQPAEEGGARVISDFYGNEVEVPAEVTSIVTGKTVVTQLVALVGGTDCLASLGEGFNYTDGMLCKEIFPGLDDLPELKDNDMNVESLLELKPDVILISSPSPDGNDVGNLLKESGLPVVYYNLANSDDLKHAVRMIAEIIGTDEAAAKAEQYVEFYENAMKETAEAAAASAEKPTAAYSRGARGLCGANSMPGEWMTGLNAENVAESLGIEAFNAEVTVEEFLNVNPQIIFCEGPRLWNCWPTPSTPVLKPSRRAPFTPCPTAWPAPVWPRRRTPSSGTTPPTSCIPTSAPTIWTPSWPISSRPSTATSCLRNRSTPSSTSKP